LTLECDAVRTVLGHGFHPPKAQHTRSIRPARSVHPQGRTPNVGQICTPIHTSQHVDDVRGFQYVWINGVPTAVSSGNPLTVSINGTANTVTGVSVDGSNSSTAPGGISGTLTLGTSITSTVGEAVVAATAPVILRSSGFTSGTPNPSSSAPATTAGLASGDTLQMVNQVLGATSLLRSNAVPDINGAYNCYIDPQQLQGLFQDGDFKLLFRGAYESQEYRQGDIINLMGVRFIPTNLAPQQASLGAGAIHRAIVVGKGALVEGDFAGLAEDDETGNPLAEVSDVDGVQMVTRAPMDRLQQIVAQSWTWIGGFVCPTDITTNPNTVPTASNAAFKRAVVLESL
jgi:hypothetical protein